MLCIQIPTPDICFEYWVDFWLNEVLYPYSSLNLFLFDFYVRHCQCVLLESKAWKILQQKWLQVMLLCGWMEAELNNTLKFCVEAMCSVLKWFSRWMFAMWVLAHISFVVHLDNGQTLPYLFAQPYRRNGSYCAGGLRITSGSCSFVLKKYYMFSLDSLRACHS